MGALKRLTAMASIAALITLPAYAQTDATQNGASKSDNAQDSASLAKRTPSPPGSYVYIGWPNNGQTLRVTHIKVWFGARNIGVAPADTYKSDTGHYHLLIDTPLPPLDQPIPNDRNHLHFGLGQTETTIDLSPGTHTLQLLMGDGDHIPHDPPLISKRITIHVAAETR
jgi:hypothetical protein